MASAAAAKKCPRPSQRAASAGGFSGHPRRREHPQLIVDEWEQIGGGLAVAGGVE